MDQDVYLVVRNSAAPSDVRDETLFPPKRPQRKTLAGAISRLLPFDRLRAWLVRGGISVLQQALFAGAHFLVNVLLARWLAPTSYGAFALAYSFFLLLFSFHMALFYEPILVYGSGRYANSFASYVRILVRSHFVVLVPASFLIAFAAPLIGRLYNREFQITFFTLALTIPFLLLIWMVRPLFFAQLNPRTGTLAGVAYVIFLLTSVRTLEKYGRLSPSTALLAMAAASLIVGAGCLRILSKRTACSPTGSDVTVSEVMRDHWRYGRWALLTAGAVWFPANIYYALLPARFGLQSTAMLRALMNLMYPLLQAMTAIILLLIPILVRQRARSGLRPMKRTVLQLVAVFIPAGLLYLSLLVVFRVPLLRLLYAGRYADVSPWTVLCVGVLPITGGVIGLLGAGLRSLEHSRLIFWAYLASTAVAFSAGVPITLAHGVPGAAFSLVLGDLPTIIILTVSLIRCKVPERVAR